jgi:hypothetical protein
LGEAFKVNIEGSAAGLAAKATLTSGRKHAVFCRLDDEVWKPPFLPCLFASPFPLNERATGPQSPTTTLKT